MLAILKFFFTQKETLLGILLGLMLGVEARGETTGELLWPLITENKPQGSQLISETPSIPPPAPSSPSLERLSFEPEMVLIPAGSFMMGSPPSEKGRDSDEEPVHLVQIAAFEMGRYEVTFAQWDVCADDDGCSYKPNDNGWGRGNQPIIGVSWNYAQEYVNWLSRKTGKHYRLPTEAEWEYAARAGTTSPYWWGNQASHESANYGKDKCCDGLAIGRDQWQYTAPVGSFSPNRWGLYDTAGNVWEWTCSIHKDRYDGSEQRCDDGKDFSKEPRVIRGGSWFDTPENIRAAVHDWLTPDYRDVNTGFRVARMLIP
ncbi:formylglycine-generating enzyme [Gammaproteobacteria bacterium]